MANQAMADDFEISGVFDRIAEKHRVIAFDCPGFGYSERRRETVWTPSAQGSLIRKALVKLQRQFSIRRPSRRLRCARHSETWCP
jgi:pimeloyl-ACP methyl ester carboxylesterase